VNAYATMGSELRNFQCSTLDELRQFIDRLDSLASVVEGQDKKWDGEFRDAWAALEEVYAVAIFRMQSTLASEDVELINASVAALADLVGAKLVEHERPTT
jgi:hypothetical protein